MSEQRILLVEDSPDMQLIVRSALGKKFALTSVATAHDAEKELRAHKFSLIILDVELPDEDGFSLLAKLRIDPNNRTIPVVFLTGKSKTSEKVMGFSLGADDYIVKPIDPLEFRARIEAKMRRLQEANEESEIFIKGPFKVNLSLQKIYVSARVQDRDLGVTSIEFKLLYYFLRHEEHVLSREKILNEVWGDGSHVTDRVIDTHVYTLRQKLGPLASYIQAVSGVGYRFSQSSKKNKAVA